MRARADITVVIHTHALLLRADVSSDGQPRVRRWRKGWPDVAAAVAYALNEGGPASRRVWVLDSEVWLGVVELPASAVAGLSDKDLADPAAFEAEAIPGLDPAEAVTAVQRRRMADQEDQFLVAQTSRVTVLEIIKAVRGAGAKFAGLGNPAGLTEALEHDGTSDSPDQQGGGWRRVEFWADSVVLVESALGRVAQIPLGVRPQGNWRKALEPHLSRGEPVAQDQTLVGAGVRVRGGTHWRENTAVQGDARWLAAGDEGGDEDDGVPAWDLADDAVAESFAAAWARQLVSLDATKDWISPTLRAPKAPAARWPAVVVGVIALGLALGAVLYQRDQASVRLTDLRGQVEHAQGDQRKINDQRKQVNQAKAEGRKKEKAIQGLEQKLNSLTKQRVAAVPVRTDRRTSLAAMMEALSRSVGEDVVVESIEHGSPQHQIEGLAASPEAASSLASDLSEQLQNAWRVSPASIEPQTGPERIVWRFTINIEPAAAGGARP